MFACTQICCFDMLLLHIAERITFLVIYPHDLLSELRRIYVTSYLSLTGYR
jgi:hypothetical protein